VGDQLEQPGPEAFELLEEVHVEVDDQYKKVVVEHKNLVAGHSSMVDLKPICNEHEDDYDCVDEKEMLMYNLMLEIHEYYEN
jgi:hypothetical protein